MLCGGVLNGPMRTLAGVSLVAIVMGLNLLEVVQLALPSLDVDTRKISVPIPVQAYLAGLTFALAASPCRCADLIGH